MPTLIEDTAGQETVLLASGNLRTDVWDVSR